jgi:hypothetical protein
MFATFMGVSARFWQSKVPQYAKYGSAQVARPIHAIQREMYGTVLMNWSVNVVKPVAICAEFVA